LEFLDVPSVSIYLVNGKKQALEEKSDGFEKSNRRVNTLKKR
jgi:hypothetical protein